MQESVTPVAESGLRCMLWLGSCNSVIYLLITHLFKNYLILNIFRIPLSTEYSYRSEAKWGYTVFDEALGNPFTFLLDALIY